MHHLTQGVHKQENIFPCYWQLKINVLTLQIMTIITLIIRFYHDNDNYRCCDKCIISSRIAAVCYWDKDSGDTGGGPLSLSVSASNGHKS